MMSNTDLVRELRESADMLEEIQPLDDGIRILRDAAAEIELLNGRWDNSADRCPQCGTGNRKLAELREQCTTDRADRDALQAALREYGVHKPDCAALWHDGPCTCGYRALLDAAEEE